MTTDEIIKIWVEAHKAAEANTNLMIRSLEPDISEMVAQICAFRMNIVGVVDSMLELCRSRVDNPIVLQQYFEAVDDAGCDACWISSSRPEHADCEEKIRRYFHAKEQLMVY